MDPARALSGAFLPREPVTGGLLPGEVSCRALPPAGPQRLVQRAGRAGTGGRNSGRRLVPEPAGFPAGRGAASAAAWPCPRRRSVRSGTAERPRSAAQTETTGYGRGTAWLLRGRRARAERAEPLAEAARAPGYPAVSRAGKQGPAVSRARAPRRHGAPAPRVRGRRCARPGRERFSGSARGGRRVRPRRGPPGCAPGGARTRAERRPRCAPGRPARPRGARGSTARW